MKTYQKFIFDIYDKYPIFHWVLGFISLVICMWGLSLSSQTSVSKKLEQNTCIELADNSGRTGNYLSRQRSNDYDKGNPFIYFVRMKDSGNVEVINHGTFLVINCGST